MGMGCQIGTRVPATSTRIGKLARRTAGLRPLTSSTDLDLGPPKPQHSYLVQGHNAMIFIFVR